MQNLSVEHKTTTARLVTKNGITGILIEPIEGLNDLNVQHYLSAVLSAVATTEHQILEGTLPDISLVSITEENQVLRLPATRRKYHAGQATITHVSDSLTISSLATTPK